MILSSTTKPLQVREEFPERASFEHIISFYQPSTDSSTRSTSASLHMQLLNISYQEESVTSETTQ